VPTQGPSGLARLQQYLYIAVHTGSTKAIDTRGSSRGGSERSRRIRDHRTLFSKLHKQVVVEILVITNLRSNKRGGKSYYLYYLDCCAQTMFVHVWYDYRGLGSICNQGLKRSGQRVRAKGITIGEIRLDDKELNGGVPFRLLSGSRRGFVG